MVSLTLTYLEECTLHGYRLEKNSGLKANIIGAAIGAGLVGPPTGEIYNVIKSSPVTITGRNYLSNNKSITNANFLLKELDPSIKRLSLDKREIRKLLDKTWKDSFISNFLDDSTAKKFRDKAINTTRDNMHHQLMNGSNAFAIPKHGIYTSDVVNPTLLKHEMGHMYQNPNNVKTQTLWTNLTGSILDSEKKAWDIAEKKWPGTLDNKLREHALDIYRANVKNTRVGTALGAAAGAAGGAGGTAAASGLASLLAGALRRIRKK